MPRLIVLGSGDVYRAYGALIGREEAPVDPTPMTEDAPLRTRLHPFGDDDPFDELLVERALFAEGAVAATVPRLVAFRRTAPARGPGRRGSCARRGRAPARGR